MTKEGLFISFEGLDGSGKTTQIKLLQKKLKKEGHEIIVTREPGGTYLGEKIRKILKYYFMGNKKMFYETELLLFSASRAQLVNEIINPELNNGKIVLCDRFIDSTLVYQGIGRNLSKCFINTINKFVTHNLTPTLTFLLDIPINTVLQRIKSRKFTKYDDRMELENINFYEKIRKGYLTLAKNDPHRFLIIDGTKNKDKLSQKIFNIVKNSI